ncbi:hypothetical protein BH11PSE5_BH11PSE5_29250 [soil metagenome]|uniref:LysM peptidoglycan-binding domain-containing protein n=1 Tax=Sphingobium sp. BS19 TaxID=3018973 RepID=UPI002492C855|nr:LysM domain-containing protein [Sphingobium sp. BS19]
MNHPFPMRARSKNLAACVLIAAALSACSQKPGKTSSAPVMIQPVSNSQQIGDVIALLDSGDRTAAEKALKSMLKREPGDIEAAVLLESIAVDPAEALGTRSFEYRVQPGETFLDLAKRFLGNRLKFYTLARYNGVTVPASLKSGTTIRIPGEAPRPAAVPPVMNKPAPVRAVPKVAPKAPVADPARAAKLRGQGLMLLNQGQVSRAVVILHQATVLDPGNMLIKRDLARAQRIRKTVKGKK